MRLGCFGLSQRAETTIIAGWYGQGRPESGLKPGRCDNVPADLIRRIKSAAIKRKLPNSLSLSARLRFTDGRITARVLPAMTRSL